MSEYRHGAHTVFEIHLHLVWVTKYRRAMSGEIGMRVRELIREICAQNDVIIVKGHVAKDHVHLFVSIPPQVTISWLVQRFKTKRAYKLLQEFPRLRKKFWAATSPREYPVWVVLLQQRQCDARADAGLQSHDGTIQ